MGISIKKRKKKLDKRMIYTKIILKIYQIENTTL